MVAAAETLAVVRNVVVDDPVVPWPRVGVVTDQERVFLEDLDTLPVYTVTVPFAGGGGRGRVLRIAISRPEIEEHTFY